MTEGWRTGRLIDFASVSTGPFGSLLHKSDYVSDGVPLVNPINIVGDQITPDPEKLIDKQTVSRLASYILRQGDIVVSRRGELGRCATIGPDESGWVCGTGCFFIRPGNDVEPRFLAAMLRSDRYRRAMEMASTGATMPSVSNTTLCNLPIAIPERNEQRRIVALLDEAFAGIATAKANVEKNLRNTEELFDGLRLAAFDAACWDEKPFEDCIEDVTYTNKIQRKNFLDEGDYPVISQEEAFINGYWNGAADVFRVDRPLLLFGDHTKALKYVDFDFVLGADGVKILKPKLFLHPRFFYHQLRTAKLDSLGYARHYKLLKELVIRYPSMDEQQRIAAELDSADQEARNLQSLYTRKVAALDELKQSLLQRAFSGQL